MIALDEPRGRRISGDGSGYSNIISGVWVFSFSAYCSCGMRHEATARAQVGDPKIVLDLASRRAFDESQDKWWECSKSHQGEVGLDAIDGFI